VGRSSVELFQGEGTYLKMCCRVGSLRVNALLFARQQVSGPECPFCGEAETVSHFILRCPAYEERRTNLFTCLQPFLPRHQTLAEFLSEDDDIVVANVLSDRYWGRGAQSANAAVCGFFIDCWELRQQDA